MRLLMYCCTVIVFTVAVAGQQAPGDLVTFERIVNARVEPQNWLTYSGSLRGERHTPLTQITPANVAQLELSWLWQANTTEKFEATPLVVDGVMYTVRPPNDIVALDAFSGRLLWSYSYDPGPLTVCCGRVNRGLAVSGRALYMGTLDAHVVAVDRETGKPMWNVAIADSKDAACGGGICYAITHAPLVVKQQVLVGVAGGDSAAGGIRGFIAALDVASGREMWRFYTIPAAGEPGNETWAGDSWKVGGAGVWNTGSYDPELNLTYWGTGNPDGDPETRVGDNLFSNSVVALDADTGRLKWYYQFTPFDRMDWDAAHIPVLVDAVWDGQLRKLLLMANKNGLTYALDRTNGQFLSGKPFVEANWLSGFDKAGRPLRIAGRDTRSGVPADRVVVWPDGGGTSWEPPSYNPVTGWFYIPARERGTQNRAFGGDGYGAVRAVELRTGERKWEFMRRDMIFHGVLTTASGVVFTGTDAGCRSRMDTSLVTTCGMLGRGGRRGNSNSPRDPALLAHGQFYALDASSGRLLWQTSVAGAVHAAPISYAVNGKQFVAITAGNSVMAFALRP